MKAQWLIGGLAPLFLNPGARWGWVVNATRRPLLLLIPDIVWSWGGCHGFLCAHVNGNEVLHVKICM
jgi:hypothetical protein